VFIPTLVAAVISLLVVVLSWRSVEEDRQRTLFNQLAAEANAQGFKVRDRIVAYSLVLRGAAALFGTQASVNRGVWQTYVEGLSLYRDFPGVQGVGFARLLQPGQVASHEAAQREDGMEDYALWPAGKRERYTAITYLEPASWRNQRAWGYDMYTEPVRREAMDRARERGEPALSGKVILVQETDSEVQAGALLYLPLWGRPTLPEGQGRAFLGWVYSPFRMNDLVQSAIGAPTTTLRLRIYDGTEALDAALLYDSAPASRATPVVAYTLPLLVEGRLWTLQFDGLPGFGRDQRGVSPGLLLVGFLSLLLVLGTWALTSLRRQAAILEALSESLRERELQYSTLVNLSRDGIAAVDGALRFTFVNPRLAEWLGQSPGRVVGTPFPSYWCSPPQEEAEHIRLRLGAGLGQTYEVRLKIPGGGERVALVSDQPLRDEQGELQGATLVLTDITERQAAAERIHYLATHDVLTGVPNRLTIRERLTRAIAMARRYDRRVAVLFIDLDYFKQVNDTYGHQVGDEVLIQCVVRIRDCLRETDSLGRLGGDEFMVLLPEMDSPRNLDLVANKIIETLERPMVIQNHEIHISASIGMVLYPDDGVDEDMLVIRADAAMYRAKCGGRGRLEAGQ
jgi:diguanylate cyclase (GGDEF)-like protein/PAS domain S-box-containing protein